ncbi:pyridoxamine 5''-phosphate oxidase [Obelidium mucronatum]|nr:pyridoxamine 5''-phosphate oxidase [Obelidium mucronatum]
MGKFFDTLEPHHYDFIEKQRMYFLASSSFKENTRVNVSPKGYESLRVVDNKVYHLDLTGSGAETIAHLTENGRVTVMLCAFEGPPNIMRLWCKARIVLAKDAEFEDLMHDFFPSWIGQQGIRSILVGDIFQVGTSCGYAVPYYDYVKQRDTLVSHWKKKSDQEMEQYWVDRNSKSIDGLPNLGSKALKNVSLPFLGQIITWTSLLAVGFLIGNLAAKR